MASRSSAIRALAFLSALMLASAATTKTRTYSVDLMLQTEGIGEAAFSPSGDRLLLERLAPYDTGLNFDWSMFGDERAMLLDVNLEGEIGMNPVASAGGERIWFMSYSPAGSKAAVGWFDGTSANAGIYDVESKLVHKLDLPIRVHGADEFNPLWLSEDEFVLMTQTPEAQRRMSNSLPVKYERLHDLARKSWRGVEPGVSVLGSGKHWKGPTRDSTGLLMRVDVRTGKATELGRGAYQQLSLSPDRRRVAALREVGDLDLAGVPAMPIKGVDKNFELTVYEFDGVSKKTIPCDVCNVTSQSLRWSPGGVKLFFSARTIVGREIKHQYYVFDFEKRVLGNFSQYGFDPETVEDFNNMSYVTPVVWMTDDIVAARKTSRSLPAPAGGSLEGRHDWYALSVGRAPVPLTTGLKSVADGRPLEDFVAVHQGKLLFMVDGDLWQMAPDGSRRNLTQDISEAVSPWCSVAAYFREFGTRPVCSGLRIRDTIRPADQAALARGWLTLTILKNGVPTEDLVFLNIDSGEVVRLARPHPHAKLVGASPLSQAAVYNCKGGDGDRLILARTDGTARELLYINRHLAGLVGGEPVLLKRIDARTTEEQFDWLLLPPGHRPGQRHPLLVYFYPGEQRGAEWRDDDLRLVSFLNMHIPAARGYAVLLASTKISGGPLGNPMIEMHEQLIQAAENVVAAGYADPERWAIMGHSYGGYGTNSVITQTNRFRAAVAISGQSNLASNYARSINSATSLTGRVTLGAMWAESGQGRMGGPPWQNTRRYVDNSPIFYADKIETPLLIIHGHDDIVSVNDAEQMFHALLRQDKDASFVRYWGEGHVINSPANIRDMWTRIFAWLDEHLRVARDPDGEIVLDQAFGGARKNGSVN